MSNGQIGAAIIMQELNERPLTVRLSGPPKQMSLDAWVRIRDRRVERSFMKQQAMKLEREIKY